MPFLSALSAISEMLSRCTIPSLSCHVMPFHDTISLMPSLSTAYIACDPVIHRLSSSAVLLTPCLSSASHISRLSCLVPHIPCLIDLFCLSSLTSLFCVSSLTSVSHVSHRVPLVSRVCDTTSLVPVSCLQSPVSSLSCMPHVSYVSHMVAGLYSLACLSSLVYVSCLTSHIS